MPDPEAAQSQLDDRVAQQIVGRAQHFLDCAHRPHADRGVEVGLVVDHPLGIPRHGVEHASPARVAGGQQVEQPIQDRHRLAVGLSLLGLLEGIDESVDAFFLAWLGAAYVVRGGRCALP